MGKIVICMGPSSSGKDTVLNRILSENTYHLQNIVLHTTRPRRINEVNGREYYFCDEQQMKQLEEEKKIIELRKYITVNGPWYYFTTAKAIELNHHNYITTNTLEGYDHYLEYYGKENLLAILFQTEEGVRLERALERERRQQNPNYSEMCRGFLTDSEDFSEENIKKRPIDAIIENNETLEKTMQEVNKVLKHHL